jgi:hypothetical protein
VRRARVAAAALLTALLCCACASQPRSPFFGDERFLVLGVDPDAEADELARQFEANGFRVLRRLRGQHFSALGVAAADGAAVKVRVVTTRGIALALDAAQSTPMQPGVGYALLTPPSSETHDADGDGFEEVFVQLLPTAADSAPCILVYRVRDSGFVDAVAGNTYALPPVANASAPWDAPHFCPEPETEPAPDGGVPDGGSAADASATPPQTPPPLPAPTPPPEGGSRPSP